MNRCDEIIANVKMEECYAGLSLVFDGSDALKEEISQAIEKISEQKKMSPDVFDNSNNPSSAKPAFYLEFSDEVQRESGDFFEAILRELHIDKCENSVIDYEQTGEKTC
jgi:rubrerythrin